MKSILKIVPLFIMFAFAFSCDEADELTEIDVKQTISSTINVDVPDAQGAAISFNSSRVIDLSTIEEIQGNSDLIESVSIDVITYEIQNYTGAQDATITNASMTFGSTTVQVSDINLQQADTNNTVYRIENTSQLNAISNVLQSNAEVNVEFDGTLDSTPVTFDVLLKVDVTVVVDVL